MTHNPSTENATPLTRYTCAPAEGDYSAGMEPSPDGDYVRYEDVMALLEARPEPHDESKIEDLCNWIHVQCDPDPLADDVIQRALRAAIDYGRES